MKARLSLGIFIAVSVIVVSLVSLVFAYPEGWGEDIRVTFDPAGSYRPSLAIDSNNNVHIAWRDYRNGNFEIYYTKLDNNGNTLVEDTRLTFAPYSSYRPSLGIDSNNNVHITWEDERDGNWEIYYTKLDNNGNTLVDDTRLTFNSTHSFWPSIAIDSNNNVHITWYDGRDGNDEIYYTKLGNNGNTLVDDTRLTFDSRFSRVPTIAIDSNNNVHITWHDWRDGNYEIYYTKLDNDGNTLVDDRRLTFDGAFSTAPSIAIDSNNNVHITWEDERDGNEEIYYTKLDNNGNTLVDDTRLTFAGGGSWYPSIVIDSNNNVHITWHDWRDGNLEVYYTKLDNNGNTLVDDTRLTFASYSAAHSPIAIDSNNNVHIAWGDDRDGNEEIYYKRSYASLPELPDLEITPSDIWFSPEEPFEEELVTIFANVSNIGDVDANNVRVVYYADDYLMDGNSFDIPAGGSVLAEFAWVAQEGTHTIKISVDPLDLIEESDETNNEAEKDIWVDPRPTCFDGIMNGDEDGVDCGGSCPFVCDKCIPLVDNGHHFSRIDVIFVPDTTYGGNTTLFLQDVQAIIDNAFMHENMTPIPSNINKFNFYYYEDEVLIDWGNGIRVPYLFLLECSFLDAATFLHRDWHIDFAYGKYFTSENNTYGTFMHEFSHIIFDLADEHNQSTYHFPLPYPNIWPSNESCRNDMISEGWNPDNCTQFCPPNFGHCNDFHNVWQFPEFWFGHDGWWRSDPLPDIMQNDGDYIVPPFQRADLRNVNWKLDQYPGMPLRQEHDNNTKAAIINLVLVNDTINFSNIKIIYNSAPENMSLTGNIHVVIKDQENNSLTSYWLWNPRIVITEEEVIYLEEANTTLAIPMTLNETFVDVYNASGSLKLRINMTEHINNFCSFQDGFCDASCPDGIDLDCAPQLQHIDNITKVEGSLVVIVANATDPDDENLVYSINDTRFTQDNNIFTWQTHFGDMGFYEVNVSVTDNYLEDSQAVGIRIYRPPKPPLPYELFHGDWP